MGELGFVEGRNLSIEWRFAHNQPDLLAPLAAELAHPNVDVIVVIGSPPTLAAQTATKTIPIVVVGPGDPIRIGLVKSLAWPGGNQQPPASDLSHYPSVKPAEKLTPEWQVRIWCCSRHAWRANAGRNFSRPRVWRTTTGP
jgi:hypothetical protein